MSQKSNILNLCADYERVNNLLESLLKEIKSINERSMLLTEKIEELYGVRATIKTQLISALEGSEGEE
jgi:hypothetical protein